MEQIILKGDYLRRGRYARSLCRIIADYEIAIKKKDGFFWGENISKEDIIIRKPLNSTDNKAFIMTVSAPWGSGKTTFMQMLKDALSGKGIETGPASFGDISFLDPSEVAIYNTWINDFYDNPLEPFVKVLIKTVLRVQSETEMAKRALKATGDTVRDVGMETVSAPAESAILGFEPQIAEAKKIIDVLKVMFKGMKNIQNAQDSQTFIDDIIGEETTIESQLREVRELIFEQIKKTKNKKIVIIIDELDRCKPSFAVQTLEIVKHLFNIPGIVYIFSLDITQLQHCVKKVYGDEFDAVGYLERFFDYTTLLPQGDLKELFMKTLEEFGVDAKQVLEESQTSAQSEEMESLKPITQADIYYQICRNFHLSVREMRAVCSSFFYLDKYELQEYPVHAKQLYFYLLVLKYKEPVKVMNAISDSKNAAEIRTKLITAFEPVFFPCTTNSFFVTAFTENEIIDKYKNYALIDCDGKRMDSHYYQFPSVLDETAVESEFKDNPLTKLSENRSLSYALYAADVKNKDIIKNLHLLEYLFRKVELYDTALPFDSTDLQQSE